MNQRHESIKNDLISKVETQSDPERQFAIEALHCFLPGIKYYNSEGIGSILNSVKPSLKNIENNLLTTIENATNSQDISDAVIPYVMFLHTLPLSQNSGINPGTTEDSIEDDFISDINNKPSYSLINLYTTFLLNITSANTMQSEISLSSSHMNMINKSIENIFSATTFSEKSTAVEAFKSNLDLIDKLLNFNI